MRKLFKFFILLTFVGAGTTTDARKVTAGWAPPPGAIKHLSEIQEGETYEIYHAVSKQPLQTNRTGVILSPHESSTWELVKQEGNVFKIKPSGKHEFLDTRNKNETFLSPEDFAPGDHWYESQCWHFRDVDHANSLWRIHHPTDIRQIPGPLSSMDNRSVITNPIVDRRSDHASLWHIVSTSNPEKLYNEFTALYDMNRRLRGSSADEKSKREERLNTLAKKLVKAQKNGHFTIPRSKYKGPISYRGRSMR